MTLTLNLSASTLANLQAAAEANGVGLESYAERVLTHSTILSNKTYQELFAPIHDAVATTGMSSQQIDLEIDAAIAESRSKR